jgi:hypothetical protein
MMKKHVHFAIISILLFLFILPLYPQQNLVSNGGFEEGIDVVWEMIAGDGGVCDYTLNTTDPHSGSNCLQADVTTLGSNSWSIQIKNGGWAVEEGLDYEATIWAKSATEGSTVNYTIGKATADYDEYAAAYGLSLTTEWTKYTLTFESTVTTSDDITLALHLTGTDTYFFDDFEVHEIITQVLSAEVNPFGTSVYIDFLPRLNDPSQELQLPFFISNENDEYKQIDTILIEPSNPRRLVIELEDAIYLGETISVSYIPGTLITETGTEIMPFTIEAENNSIATPDALNVNETGVAGFYPNPADNALNILAEEFQTGVTYSILDLSGRVLISGPMNTGPVSQIDISTLKKGCYIILLRDNFNHTFVNKFIKK